MAVLAPFPSFLIIGFQRNATGWLRHNLDAHPEICAPPVHTSFFTDPDRMARLGLRWYREQFEVWDGEPVVGEVSCSYANWNSGPNLIARRIQKLLPDVRLIALVDDPLVRFHSALRRLILLGKVPADVDPTAFYRFEVEGIVALETVAEGIQGQGLQLYDDLFGDQLQVVFVEDIRADPAGTYARVLGHVGADPTFVPADVSTVRYSDRHRVDPVLPGVEARQQVYAWYRKDVERLAELTGRDLSAWDPGESAGIRGNSALVQDLIEGFRARDGGDPSLSEAGV